MKFRLRERIKFFGLSYFSDKIARTAADFGFGTLFLALVLSFLFFLCGYMAADTVPFAVHYENAGSYKEFINNAFSEGGISLSVKNSLVCADSRINTYADGGDKAVYAMNGYDLIVDTRPSDMLIEFTQVAVKGGTEISYESYLALSAAEKNGYKLETRYTDKELVVSSAFVEKITVYLDGICAEGSLEYNAKAAAAYGKLKEEKANYSEDEYGKQLYYLYVRFYYASVSSVYYDAQAPVLRDYYYRNYIAANKAYYFYLFDGMCAGSFKTDGGVPVVFGGYFNKCADGAVDDVGGLIKTAFYDTVSYTFGSYFMGAVMQLPYLIFIPLILALLLWGVGKAVKNGWEKTFSGCFKTVSAFIWFSGFLTALVTFVCGFFVSAKLMYSYMPLIFGLLLLIRTIIFCITAVISKRKPPESEIENNNDDIFGEQL